MMQNRHLFPISLIQALLPDRFTRLVLLFRLSLFWLVISGFSVNATSLYVAGPDVPEPVQIVESRTKLLMDELSNRKAEFDTDPKKLIYFARNVALGSWNLKKTSRLILGSNWYQADVTQQQRFEEEFLRTLMRYVVKAYGFYDDSLVEILSYDWQAQGSGGWVRSVVRLPAGLKVSVDYRMDLDDDKHWKMVDVRVEGISLVSSKRTEYRDEIRQNGLEALIKAMADKNQRVLTNN